jgi:hypothetical protein
MWMSRKFFFLPGIFLLKTNNHSFSKKIQKNSAGCVLNLLLPRSPRHPALFSSPVDACVGHKRIFRDLCPMSALPPIADMAGRQFHVRFVPKADVWLTERLSASDCPELS